MRIKKLVGDACYLSPMNVEDAGQYAAWLNDLEVSQFTHLAGKNITLETEREVLSVISREHNYGIVSMDTGELIGNCGLSNLDPANGTAEIGIFIGNKQFWNRGIGTEALRLLIDYAFRYLNLSNIMLQVYEFNERAVSSYRKIGFKTVGIRRNALLRNLKRHNIVFMDIIPDDFYAGA